MSILLLSLAVGSCAFEVRIVEPEPPRFSPLFLTALENGCPDSSRLHQATSQALRRLLAAGFWEAVVTVSPQNREGGGWTAVVDARPGPRLGWGPLLAPGHDTSLVRRLARWQRGRPADTADLGTARRRLTATGFWTESAPPSVQRVPRTLRVDPVVHLKAIAASEVAGVAGWDPRAGWAGAFSVRLANAFGDGRRIGLDLRRTASGGGLEVSWAEPHPLEAPFSVLLEASLRDDSLVVAQKASVDLTWPIGSSWDLGGGLGWAASRNRVPDARSRGRGLSRWTLQRRPYSANQGYRDLYLRILTEIASSPAALRLDLDGLGTWQVLGPLGGAVGARASLPLGAGPDDPLVPDRLLGGLRSWRGLAEGSRRSRAHAVGVVELRTQTPGSGVGAIWTEPGLLQAPADSATPAHWKALWTFGLSTVLERPGWIIEVAMGTERRTLDIGRMRLHAALRHRF